MKTIQQHRYFQYELRLLQHQRVHSILLTALALLLALGKIPRRNAQVNMLDAARYCGGRAIFRIKPEVVWQVIAHRLLITTEIH